MSRSWVGTVGESSILIQASHAAGEQLNGFVIYGITEEAYLA